MSNFEKNINIVLECPYCYETIILYEPSLLKMRFFRHGIFKNTGKWINPYISNVVFDRYILNKKIAGCGKFFKIIYEDNNYYADPILV
jgi:hypothetical protein